MVTIFIVGIVITFLTGWMTYYLMSDGNYFTNIKESWNDTPVLVSLYFICSIFGLLMLYFGFVTPSSQISTVTDNGNGTLTSIEYSISGDSVIIHNIKAPKEIYGVVTDVKHGSRMNGKMIIHYVKVTHKLNDGRIITEEYRNSDLTKGHNCKMVETFYPSYKTEFYY